MDPSGLECTMHPAPHTGKMANESETHPVRLPTWPRASSAGRYKRTGISDTLGALAKSLERVGVDVQRDSLIVRSPSEKRSVISIGGRKVKALATLSITGQYEYLDCYPREHMTVTLELTTGQTTSGSLM
eukprot:scaffold495093_cov46-Prasinocladus_malaysianus.AAC.1